ncbi:MAG: LppX_LprAFG lipoprotein [Actinomycetia bacterium]|nr:LppX_LprAFG lipoprotein [Actinomycetes bacterium]
MTRLAHVVIATLATLTACSGNDSPATDRLPTEPAALLAASAQAMGEVETARFTVEASGTPIHVDPGDTLALESVEGRFVTGVGIDALLTVEVAGALTTQVGAVAIGDEIFLSNPLTGEFELLPPDFGFDPASFFDPVDGWRPLLEALGDAEYRGNYDRGGDRYRLRGTAPADRIETLTAGLASGQDVDVELWIDPVSGLITALEMTTENGDGSTDWVVEMTDYGTPIEIERPTVGP